MQRVLFVAGAGTEIGKTFISAGLIRALRQRGLKVGALKPAVSGFDEANAADSDPGRLLAALDQPLTPNNLAQMSPWRFRAPLAAPMAAAAEGRSLLAYDLVELCRTRMEAFDGDVLIIESAGGLMSPIAEDATNLDLAERLGAPVLVVGGTYLGSISHTLCALAAARAHQVAVRAIVLSESGGDAPALAPTVDAVRRFGGEVPIIAVPRVAEPDLWSADTLAEELLRA
jgi:dethiobiotin synthetase